MEKKTEIQILKSLKGDTYFNQFFTNEDIDKMCQNISNDFAIESGCDFTKGYEVKIKTLYSQLKEAKDEVEQLRKLAQQEKEELATKIIEEMDDDDTGTYDAIEEDLGIDFVIKTKHNAEKELTDDEIDYLVKKLN